MYGCTLNTRPQNGSAGSGLRLDLFRLLAVGRRGRFAFALALLRRSMPSTGGTSSRIRQIRGHRVENRLHAHAVQRRAAQHRLNLQVHRRLADHFVNERLGNWLLGQRQLHQLVAVVVERFEQPLAPQLGLVGQVLVGISGATILLPSLPSGNVSSFILHEVDHAAKRIGRVGRPLADGNLQRDRPGVEPVADLLEHGLEVGPFAVQLVDERQPRHMILVGLPPDRFALRFDALAGAEHDDAAIEHAQAPLDLGREIDVAGRIDQIDRRRRSRETARRPSRS